MTPPVVPALFVIKAVLFPKNHVGTFAENQLTIDVRTDIKIISGPSVLAH